MSHEEQYFQAFTATSAAYITGLGIQGLRVLEDPEEGLYLEDVTSFIQLSGVIQGGVILTVDHSLAGALARKFMLEEITEEEAAQYGVEVVAEISNVISGNALTDRDEHDIFLGAPLVIVTKKAELRSKFSNFFVSRFQTDSGNFYCIYIPSQNKSELARILAI